MWSHPKMSLVPQWFSSVLSAHQGIEAPNRDDIQCGVKHDVVHVGESQVVEAPRGGSSYCRRKTSISPEVDTLS